MADTVYGVSLQSRTRICFNLVFLIAIWSSCTIKGEQHQVAVRAIVGGDAILPCFIKPPLDMEKKGSFQWNGPDRTDLDPQYVYLRQDGRYIGGEVNPRYVRRVSLLAEELAHGDISLRLSQVELSDQGTYLCSVPSLSFSTEIQLRVGLGSRPVVSWNGSRLTCASGCWFPQLVMSWLDSDGAVMDPAGVSVVPNGTSRQCYEVQSTVTVTRSGLVTCRVHLPHFNHSVDVPFHIVLIPERNIPTEGASTGSALDQHWIAVIAVALIAVFIILILVAGVVLYYRRWTHAEGRLKRTLEERPPSSGIGSLSENDRVVYDVEADDVTMGNETTALKGGSMSGSIISGETGFGDYSACVTDAGTDDDD